MGNDHANDDRPSGNLYRVNHLLSCLLEAVVE